MFGTKILAAKNKNKVKKVKTNLNNADDHSEQSNGRGENLDDQNFDEQRGIRCVGQGCARTDDSWEK